MEGSWARLAGAWSGPCLCCSADVYSTRTHLLTWWSQSSTTLLWAWKWSVTATLRPTSWVILWRSSLLVVVVVVICLFLRVLALWWGSLSWLGLPLISAHVVVSAMLLRLYPSAVLVIVTIIPLLVCPLIVAIVVMLLLVPVVVTHILLLLRPLLWLSVVLLLLSLLL